MGTKWRERCRSLGVYFWLCALSWALSGASFVIGRIELAATGYRSLAVTATWCWIFAFPVMLADAWGFRLPEILWCLNPFFYGGMWWFAWRMCVVMRRKPAE